MIPLLTFSILGLLLLLVVYGTFAFPAFMKKHQNNLSEPWKETLEQVSNYLHVILLVVVLAIVGFIWYFVKGTPVEGHVMEWMNIIVRVMHFTFGIAWIGASFYFVFLENALNRTENVRDELAGNLWAVHGGGFYYLEKYKVAPKEIPKDLHWFKYEAYFTWISGFSLLAIVYYFNAQAMLIDKNVLDITSYQGIAISISSFVAGWILYDQLCKSKLIQHVEWFAALGFLLLMLFAWFYTQVFSARAAYIHFGALIGSIMVANVFFVIIPSQKAMVKAAKEGKPLNPTLGKKALARSLHNNYFTLPVLFVMVSNHFPSTFGYQYPWLTLGIISLGAAGVKHWLNLREKKQESVWVMPVSVLLLLSAAFISAPNINPNACNENVSFAEVNNIIQVRCVSCHSASPTDDIFTKAPNGVMYDTPEQITSKKDLIMQRVVHTKTMPQNNKTNITEEERNLIRCWIDQGAKLK
jgi:uncharacterized membrane protein